MDLKHRVPEVQSAIQNELHELHDFELVGSGGQKIVFSAKDSDDTTLIVKVIFAEADAKSRLEREVQAARKVSSNRVPEIFDIGEFQSSTGNPCIWLKEQYVPGVSLRAYLSEQSRLSKTELQTLGLQMLEALLDVKAADIVHRDIKPDNIIRDPSGDFWLIDFGLSRHLNMESLTADGRFGVVGTLGYSPPEQFENQKAQIDHRTDLFALGVTLWECATGTHPFRERIMFDHLALFKKIKQNELPTFHTKSGDAEFDGKLEGFLRVLLKPRVSHRPRTIEESTAWFEDVFS